MKLKSHRTATVLLAFSVLHAQTYAQKRLETSSPISQGIHGIHMLGKCSFRIKNTLSGEFRIVSQDGISKNSNMGNVWIHLLPRMMDLNIPLNCYSRDDEKNLEMALGARQVNGKWWPAGGYEKGCEPYKLAKTGICFNSDHLPFYPQQKMRATPLNGKNWQGVGILTDDTTGDEKARQRKFRYCLYHADIALCGEVYVRNLRKPHNDVFYKVQAVLNSIEFAE